MGAVSRRRRESRKLGPQASARAMEQGCFLPNSTKRRIITKRIEHASLQTVAIVLTAQDSDKTRHDPVDWG